MIKYKKPNFFTQDYLTAHRPKTDINSLFRNPRYSTIESDYVSSCKKSGFNNMLHLYDRKAKVNKKPDITKHNMNNAGVPKYQTPAIKEWSNSLYAFNNNTVKTVCNTDKIVLKLIKSYFNLYSLKLNGNSNSNRMQIRNMRMSTNRLLVSKPEIKHSSDDVNITIYTYDRRMKYYTNKINASTTLDRIVKKDGNDSNPYSQFINNVREKSLQIGPKIRNLAKILLETVNIDRHTSMLKRFTRLLVSSYMQKYMRKEVISLTYKQSILLEESKYDKQFLSSLISLSEKVYNKKVTFNIVNLKYFYNSGSIFSEALLTKLKNRLNKPTRVLKTSLDTFDLPPINKLAVYNDIYAKKNLVQNPKIEHIVNSSQLYRQNYQDILDTTLKSYSKDKSTVKDATANVNQITESLRYKFTSGIRIQLAGRLSKRNTADRSMFKLRYKGNVKNADSSFKGLPAVLLRGHAKSNVLYNKSNSKLRIGSFGLKTWVSSD